MTLALIVDDEPDILELLQLTLARMDIDAVPASDLDGARTALARRPFDLCLTDMRLPDGDGIDLVRYIGERHPHLPVAIITAHGNMETAIEAMKAGAFDFISKPVDLQALRRLVQSALRLNQGQDRAGRGAALLGRSPAMNDIRHLIRKLARSQAPVYISGESGTGKELAARLIHQQGPRAEAPFVPVNCGAIPADLMEAELFGYRKGAFTGATADRNGLFQAADGGTLFLDEVADLPTAMQVKLLRAIQEKAVRPLGATREVPVDVRVLSATHKDLAALVERGDFREDLFYRIDVIELHLPALRERPEDIPLLVEHFLTRAARSTGLPRPRMSPEALDALRTYTFPGNVRELENILERATALCEHGRIEAADLQLRSARAPAPAADDRSLEDYLGEVERQAIVKALEATHWNRTAAARRLGMTLRSLRYRIAKLGIE